MCVPPARGSIADMIELSELTKDHAPHKMTKRCPREVFVRSPRRSGLTKVLTGMGATVLAEPDAGLPVTGIDAWRIAAPDDKSRGERSSSRHDRLQAAEIRSVPWEGGRSCGGAAVRAEGVGEHADDLMSIVLMSIVVDEGMGGRRCRYTPNFPSQIGYSVVYWSSWCW